MPQTIGVLLKPLDVLFFRDGRPFEAGMRGAGGLPSPQVLAGALRTHLWRRTHPTVNFEQMANELNDRHGDVAAAAEALGVPGWAARMYVRGPWFWSNGNPSAGPLVPAPADLVTLGKKHTGGEIARLHPAKRSPPGWRPPQGGDGMVPLWRLGAEDFEGARGFLDMDGLKTYLNGGVPPRKNLVEPKSLYTWEDRVGIAVESDRGVAEDHMLYSARLLRLQKDIAFYAEVILGDDAPGDAQSHFDDTLNFGGEGRRVSMAVTEPTAWPQPENRGDGDLALLVTPGIFLGEHNWRPDRPGLPRIRAAAVPTSIPISGWDLARKCPKPTRHAVVAGSVYLFDGRLGNGPFVNLAQGDASLAGIGFGLALKGVWNYV